MKVAGPNPAPDAAASELAAFAERANAHRHFVHCFEDCRPRLVRLCRRMLGRSDGTDDVLQDTFLRAFRGWSGFDGQNPAAWLSTIAQHVCIDQIRAGRAILALDDVDENIAVNDEMRACTAIQIRAILQGLPERQRQCLKLFYIEGFSAKEVAALTGFSEKQVKSYLQNGRRNFIREWNSLNRTS